MPTVLKQTEICSFMTVATSLKIERKSASSNVVSFQNPSPRCFPAHVQHLAPSTLIKNSYQPPDWDPSSQAHSRYRVTDRWSHKPKVVCHQKYLQVCTIGTHHHRQGTQTNYSHTRSRSTQRNLEQVRSDC